ncbi:MAG: hypothetical protein ISS16_05190 [Ignavibacteria bacterium]|nr:hypothetical protein [Ignavibacteria bacterium]
MDILLKSEYSAILILIVTIVSILLAYFFYRKSKLKAPLKYILPLIRFLSIWFILVLFLSPVLSYLIEITQKPINVFLIDNSLSLNIDKKDSLLKETLNKKITDIENDKSENKYFLFSNELNEEIFENDFDAIELSNRDNYETNLSKTLHTLFERLENKNISSINIISDGIINSGGNPSHFIKLFGIPVNYFLIGDTAQKPDLLVKDIFFNKVAFIESVTPLDVEINSFQFDKNIKVNLYEDGSLIDSRIIEVNQKSDSYNASFKLISPVESIKKYKIEIEAEPNEITNKNNYSEFFIRYVDNKFKILVFSGGPGADFAFISEEINKIKNFEAEFRTQKSANEFYEGPIPDMNNIQAFIFIDFPTSITNVNILNDIKASTDRNESSLFFMASRNTDYKKLSLLESILPFKTVSASNLEKEIGVKTVSNFNADVLDNFSERGGLSKTLELVNSLPGIFKTGSVFSFNPEAETILISSPGREPILVTQNTTKNKSAAFLGHGIYKWRLNPAITNSEQALNGILTGIILSITDKEKKKKFNVETTKQIYSPYESVKFMGIINDNTLTGGLKIKVRMYNENFNEQIELKKTGNFSFEGQTNIMTPDDYFFTAELYSKGELIDSDTKKYSIGENNFEFKKTRSDNSLLQNLALTTGGNDFTNEDIKKINELIYQANIRESQSVKSSENVFLNFNLYYLFIVIFLLSLEWFLRKRYNLP